MRFFLIFSLPDRLIFSTISGEIFFRKKSVLGKSPFVIHSYPQFLSPEIPLFILWMGKSGKSRILFIYKGNIKNNYWG